LIYSLEKYSSGIKSDLQKEDFRKYLMEIMSIDRKGRLEQVQAFQAKLKTLGEEDVLVKALQEIARDRM